MKTKTEIKSDPQETPYSRGLVDSLKSMFHVELSRGNLGTLEDFAKTVIKESQHFSLTGFKNVEQFFQEGILDALQGIPFIEEEKGKTIVDIGSGSGLPGVPLAILFPHSSFILIDSNKKKASFLSQVAETLKLTNIRVVDRRLEDFLRESGQEKANNMAFMARAVAPLTKFLKLFHKARVYPSSLLLFKGSTWKKELEEVPLPLISRFPFKYQSVSEYSLPPLNKKLCLIKFNN